MPYRLRFIFLTLFFIPLHAEIATFEVLNLPLTQIMQTNKDKATYCIHPKSATKTLDEDFKYGCFCGKDYPRIEHPSKKNYKELTLNQRQELITQYYLIKPYDDIDAVCMQHDICYISKATNAQSCNDALYHELKHIRNSFKKTSTQSSLDNQCKTLASDISSMFKTIFTVGEDTSIPRIIAFGVNTFITIGTKVLSLENYPSKGQQCLL